MQRSGWYAVTMYRHLFGVSVGRGIWCWLLSTLIAYALASLTLTVLMLLAVSTYYAFDPHNFNE